MESWGKDGEEVYSRQGSGGRRLAWGVVSFGVMMIMAVMSVLGSEIVSETLDSDARMLSQDVWSSSSSLKNGRWNTTEYDRSVSDPRLVEVKLYPVEVRGRIQEGWVEFFQVWCQLQGGLSADMMCPMRWAAYLADEGEWSTPGLRLCPEVYDCTFTVREYFDGLWPHGRETVTRVAGLDLWKDAEDRMRYDLVFSYTQNKTGTSSEISFLVSALERR